MTFNPTDVDLNTASVRDVICYIDSTKDAYNGDLGARISSVFVILIVSSAVTFFPVLATRVSKFKIPLYVYLFARYFGSGVIVATAYIHLLDPSYSEIGPATCVGLTGGWVGYSWPPAIAMASCLFVFALDFGAERYVEKKFGLVHAAGTDVTQQGNRTGSIDAAMMRYSISARPSVGHQNLHSSDQNPETPSPDSNTPDRNPTEKQGMDGDVEENSILSEKERLAETGFKQQIAAFLILEFGVLFHSVIIGLTLATAGAEFATLYPVIIFHQSFEGLGIGARLSAIPFPKRYHYLPWVLCAGYGLTTPIAIAIGLGVRTTYNSGSYTANVVSGVLDATSAGILMWTGLVELLARDFLFNPDRTRDDRQLTFMMVSVFLGAGLMALLGKWA